MTTTKKIITIVAFFTATSLMASNGETLFKSCATCHGVNAQKAALGKSKIIKGWDSKKIKDALYGYKKGTYGRAMKGVMKGQVARLSDEDIKVLADYISSIK
ncbi:cytochrome C [Malaciobacter molluscorum]|uniref:c-type cytochrome n=1 Tax=Malaciobacter molluscorum TaxID=1032072 RepID=UPI00100B7B2B|nr:c-type cytochrome [Malaciobacter molluscorum]RXJ97323.1 cytochrome C [Malaciobacter molluscorum]